MNLEFLKKIKQKLQVGNTRSIHLNLFPSRFATRLDVSELNSAEKDLASKFLNKLLTQPSFTFNFKIEASEKPEDVKKNLINKRLSTIYYENEDTFLEHGIKTFGFGFPTLIYRTKNDTSKIINAPLIIWKLDLQRDKNEWIIQRDEESGITINDVLLNYLEQDLSTSGFFVMNDEHLQDMLVDKNELLEIINKVTKQISANSPEIISVGEITPMLDKNEREILLNSSTNPQIVFSGVFGLYRTQKEALINDIKTLIADVHSYKFDALTSENYQSVRYSAVETDPTQEHALKSISESSKLVIHGPPGTGKSQTLTAIIVNALFNKAKCLVVCEKRTALEVIRKNLGMLGLQGLCGLIEDVNRDRKKIIEAVRDSRLQANPVNRNILDVIFSQADSEIEKINTNHKFYGRYLLNNNTWSDLAGKFLSLSKEESKYDKLYAALKNCGIDFLGSKLSEEYNHRYVSIARNQKLYDKAKENAAGFKVLSDNLFEKRAPKDIVVELNENINKKIVDLEKVILDAENHHNIYSKALSEHYAQYYSEFNSALQNIYDIYSQNTTINGYLFANLGVISGILTAGYSIFSKKYKILKRDKIKIQEEFNSLRKFTEKNYFTAEVTPADKNLSEAEIQITDIKQKLDDWYNEISNVIAKELSEYHLNSFNKNAYTDKSAFEKVDNDNSKILAELNSLGYFNQKFEFREPANLSRLLYLKDTKDHLKLLVNDLDSLYDYTHWRKDYVSHDETGKKIIDNLIFIESEKWEKDFEMWYMFNILIANEKYIELRDDSLYGSLKENFKKIKQYQLEIIKDYWLNKQEKSASDMEKRTGINVNTLYNKSRNNKFQKRNSLRRIIAAHFELFTDYFPVMLVNPAVCSSLFDMKEGLFDVVIFDEASQLRIEEVYAAKLRGKNKVVAGDENQMPPSSYFASAHIYIDSDTGNEDEADILETAIEGLADSESLLEFAIRRGYKETYLDIHYRSRHPDLINFSNAAFYNSRLNPSPPSVNYKAIRYIQTYGIYDAAEGVNFVEATKVISLIDELVILENKENNPSIGVATFNIFQRNYLLDMIQKKCDNDTMFAEKINILRNKPGETFFVKNLENIQGDERDVIIISTTFGKKADGSFLQNFGPVNQEKGFRLLNVIITRAKHNVIVCTSIPDEYISEYAALLPVAGNRGRGIFYAYLAYARAVEKNESKEKENILDMVRANSEGLGNIDSIYMGSEFEKEVVNMLSNHISPERILTDYDIGGFKIDIAVKPENSEGKLVIIECDGANYHSSPEAYNWDMFRESYLSRFGVTFIRIWSVNWWNNPEKELSRLVDIINKSANA